ncbi:MAG TPA: CHAD domain-containing protein [Solirubrobacterales bacterium]|jgi:CHAD domain-containing protein|nr:CHAD domain-containing protein [Solirubrobacterales bacterium]
MSPSGQDGVERPSRSYRLKTKENPAAGIRRIALGRADKALDALGAADEGELSATIHGVRKDLKKLRALTRLVRDELGEKRFKAENRRYRDAGRLLSESRDAEVKLETLAGLRKRSGDDIPSGDGKGWERALERERDQVGDAARGETAARIDEAKKAVEKGRRRILAWPLEADSWHLVEAGLSQSYRRGRRAMKDVQAKPRAKSVHEWRKRAKDLWYQLRIVRNAWPGLLQESADQVHELADLLGDHHDLAVLGEDLEDRDGVDAREALRDLIEKRQEEILASALDLGRRIYAEKPKAFRRRLASYWSAWR